MEAMRWMWGLGFLVGNRGRGCWEKERCGHMVHTIVHDCGFLFFVILHARTSVYVQ